MSKSHGLDEAMQIARRTFPSFTTPTPIESSWEEDLQAWHLWQRDRGGGSLLMSGEDGSFLFASSAVPTDAHFAAFARGRRTDPGSVDRS